MANLQKPVLHLAVEPYQLKTIYYLCTLFFAYNDI